MLKVLKHAYLNTKSDLYPSDFVNLTRIEDGVINFPKRTTFIDEVIKDELRKDPLTPYNDACFITHLDGVYSLITLFDLQSDVKKHEFVIPDVVQGMVLNYQHYNTEAAPIALLSSQTIDFKTIVDTIEPLHHHHYDRGDVYVYTGQSAVKVLSHIANDNDYYLADGHHRFLASQHILAKQGCLAMITNTSDVTINSIHRTMTLKEPFTESIAYLASENIIEVEGPVRRGVIGIEHQGKEYFYKLQNFDHDIFGNHDVYRLHTQIISQGFKEYDSTQLKFDTEKEELGDDEVRFSTWPMNFEEFQSYADRNIMLPPKSTSFTPKCPSMLVMNIID